MMNISDLYDQVAEMHAASINQGFLSTLGNRFVSLLYEAIDAGPDSVLIVSQQGGRVVGFVAGATAMGPIYRRMLRSWVRLLLALLPSLWSPRRIWQIIEILRYSLRPSAGMALPTAELLSIAVDLNLRGKGLAEALYLNLSEHFRLRGFSEFKIIVGADLAPAHRLYKRMGAVAVADIQIHGGNRSIAYVQALSSARDPP